MKKIVFIAFVFASFVFTQSCKKSTSSSSQTSTKSKNQYLTAHTWKYNSVFWGAVGSTLADMTSTEDPCWFDNTLTFSGNGTFTVSEGTDQCSGEPSTYSGTWVLSTDQSKLTTTSLHDTTTYNIGTVDDNTLTLSTFDLISGVNFETRDVYKK